MAIEFVDANQAATSATDASISVPTPSGILTDDYEVLAVISMQQTTSPFVVTGGWTNIYNELIASNSKMGIFAKRWASDSPSSYSASLADGSATHYSIAVAAWRGISTGTALVAQNLGKDDGNDLTCTAPSVGALASAALLVCCWGQTNTAGTDSTWTVPGTMTKVADIHQPGTVARRPLGIAYELVNGGDPGARTAVLTTSGAGAGSEMGAMLAFLPSDIVAPAAPTGLTAVLEG